MRTRIAAWGRRLTLAQGFMLASLIILVSGMFGIGAWVGQKIETGVIDRTAATTALYVDSAVSPLLQELATGDTLKPENRAALDTLLFDTELGKQIAIFKVWSPQGKVIWSTDKAEVGQTFPVEEGLADALRGQVAAHITDLSKKVENASERQPGLRLLEIYSPVRLRGTNQVISVAEFYQSISDLQVEIADAQRESWLIVGAATLVMYLLLALFVQRASNTIVRQQRELSRQVGQLRELLAQNQELHRRVRRAAARTTALNERFLRRISAELHDGPAQDLGLALLRLDHAAEGQSRSGAAAAQETALAVVASSVRHALEEVRAISGGLGVPQLHNLTLSETLERAVRAHERRTHSRVTLETSNLPETAPLPIKITMYRVVQEALNNAYRHAGGVGQRVRLIREADHLLLQVSDQGPGFDAERANGEEHLGLSGMRERVESLAGTFWIDSHPGASTTVTAQLPLQATEAALDEG